MNTTRLSSCTPARIEPLDARIAPAVIYAVDTSNDLISFDSANTGTLLGDVGITGLQAQEIIAGIDFRPATGELYALGLVDDGATRTGRLYKLNTNTGAATLVGATFFSNTLPDTGNYGFDFNPVADRIRLTNDFDDSFRIHPDTGTFAGTDTDLSDPNQPEFVIGAAYDQNFGSNVTTLYGLNLDTSELVRIGGVDGNPSPNLGAVTPIGFLSIGGLTISPDSFTVGFDIAGSAGGPELGWALIRIGDTHLYNVDLTTGALTDVGQVGAPGAFFRAVAVQFDAPDPTIAVGGKSATWTDIDGDLVTLKITKGTLTADHFRMLAGASGSALAKLTLTDPLFAGSNVIITAKPGINGGNGSANIGKIDATGVDLGLVTIPGDLAEIDAGNGGNIAPSVKALTARSLDGLDAMLTPSTNVEVASTFADGVGKITIAGTVSSHLTFVSGKVGPIFIGGDLKATSKTATGVIEGDAKVSKLTIKGSIIGEGTFSGSINLPAVPSVTIGGSLVGAEGSSTGSMFFGNTGSAKSVITIGGSLLGGDGQSSARISIAGQTIVKIAGEIRGGDGFASGGITAADLTSTLKSLTVASITSGTGGGTGIVEVPKIGTVLVKGNVTGNATDKAAIIGFGVAAPANAAAALAIGKVTIGGDLVNARILAGTTSIFFGISSDAAIGSVKIGRNMIASTIAAGINPGNSVFGDSDDGFVLGNNGNPAIIAKIASVTIGGQLAGTSGGLPDSFGIEAEQIGSILIGKTKLKLTAAKDNFLTGYNSDVRVREF